MKGYRCRKRRKFRDRIAADLTLATLQHKGRDEQRSYYCSQHHAWHLTSMPLNNGGRRSA